MRYFLAACLPNHLANQLQPIRRRHSTGSDPLTPPHVTLVRSWSTTPEKQGETMARLQAVQPQLRPFDLKLGGIGAFHSPQRVIYLNVEPTEGLWAARRALLEAIDSNDSRPFRSHLTLAKGLEQDKFETLLAQLNQSKWQTGRWAVQVNQVWLMQRELDEPTWQRRQQIDLLG